MAGLARRYREAAAALGRRAVVAVRRDGWVADDRETAVREYQPAIQSFQRFMRELDSDDAWHRDQRNRDAEEEIVSNRLLLGTPEDCVRAARQYIDEAGVDWFVMRFRQPDVSLLRCHGP